MKTKQLFTKVYLIYFLFVLTACGASREEIAATMAVQTIEARGTGTANVEQAVSNALTQTAPTLTPTPEMEGTHTPIPDAVTLLEQAFSYSQQGDDEKAIETYTKAIEVDPLYAQAYINRCAVYADNGETEKGLADCNRGLGLDPTNVLGYSNRSQAHIDLENFDKALDDIRTVLGLTDDEVYIKLSLFRAGRIYDEQGEQGLALAAYSAVLEIDQFSDYALISRGQIYLQQEDTLRAFGDLAIVLETTQNPELQQAAFNIFESVYPEGTTFEDAMAASKPYYEQALQFEETGNYEKAIEMLGMAIEIDPLNSEYYYKQSKDLWLSENSEEAIRAMNYSIALNPSDPRGYYWRGMMEANLNMPAEAIADLEKALKFDLSADAEADAKQVLDNMYKSLETCQFTEFEVVNDAENPTFAFIFEGPPGEPFTTSIFSYPEKDAKGTVSFAMIPETGVVPTGEEYKLKEDENTPIDFKIDVAYPGCRLRKIVTWPEIDILVLLSEGALTTTAATSMTTNTPTPPAPTPIATPPVVLLNYLENPQVTKVASSKSLTDNPLNIKKGEGVIIDFQFTDKCAFSTGLFQGQNNTAEWMSFFVDYQPPAPDVNWAVQIGEEYTWGHIPGEIKLKYDTWYSVLLAVDRANAIFMLLWETASPSNKLSYRWQASRPPTKPSWYFEIQRWEGVNNVSFGDITVVQFDDIQVTP